MSDAAAHIRRLDRSIARAGNRVTLERLSADAQGALSVIAAVTCPAFVRATVAHDQVTTIGEVDPIYRGGGLVRVNLLCRGSIEDGLPETRVVLSASSLGTFGTPRLDDRIIIHAT